MFTADTDGDIDFLSQKLKNIIISIMWSLEIKLAKLQIQYCDMFFEN